ncbi:HAD family hydrolase [Nocardioides sp. NPDC127503]|uniref:HAD family hydrolase n=1 Tax=Nocardioides sp. NPDC127503 TaxID=3154516 RepID=UPI00331EF2DA
MIHAVIFDLFGTLVEAPSPTHRRTAVAALAQAASQRDVTIDAYLESSWTARHDGTLPTVPALSEHLIDYTGSRASADDIAATWRALAQPRLLPDLSVTNALECLRTAGIRVGLISDASAEIAEAWQHSPAARLVNHAVFSCTARALKPAPSLYREVLAALDAPPTNVLYVGDGGGDELHGAERLGVKVIRVARRGVVDALSYGETTRWSGAVLDKVENLPAILRACA